MGYTWLCAWLLRLSVSCLEALMFASTNTEDSTSPRPVLAACMPQTSPFGVCSNSRRTQKQSSTVHNGGSYKKNDLFTKSYSVSVTVVTVSDLPGANLLDVQALQTAKKERTTAHAIARPGQTGAQNGGRHKHDGDTRRVLLVGSSSHLKTKMRKGPESPKCEAASTPGPGCANHAAECRGPKAATPATNRPQKTP